MSHVTCHQGAEFSIDANLNHYWLSVHVLGTQTGTQTHRSKLPSDLFENTWSMNFAFKLRSYELRTHSNVQASQPFVFIPCMNHVTKIDTVTGCTQKRKMLQSLNYLNWKPGQRNTVLQALKASIFCGQIFSWFQASESLTIWQGAEFVVCDIWYIKRRKKMCNFLHLQRVLNLLIFRYWYTKNMNFRGCTLSTKSTKIKTQWTTEHFSFSWWKVLETLEGLSHIDACTLI